MSWTLTHRFLNAAGRPASGWVYFDLSTSPVITETQTVLGTAEKVKLDKTGSFTVTDLPSAPDLYLVVWPRIVTGDPFALGPVTVPTQPDGTTVNLGELITDWPTTSTAPFATSAEVAALATQVESLSELVAAIQAAIASIILRLEALEEGQPPPVGAGTFPAALPMTLA